MGEKKGVLSPEYFKCLHYEADAPMGKEGPVLRVPFQRKIYKTEDFFEKEDMTTASSLFTRLSQL